jgi:hypothetical protein
MGDTFDAEAGQPLPVTTVKSVDVAVQVAASFKDLGHPGIAQDIEARIAIGERKYGKRLQSFNGRDAVKDLYDEVLDALNYAKQIEIEGLDSGGFFAVLTPIAVQVKARLPQ